MATRMFDLGDAVELIDPNTPPADRLVGRICCLMPFGAYCVQLEQIGCRKVQETLLSATTRPAPACSPECSQGC